MVPSKRQRVLAGGTVHTTVNLAGKLLRRLRSINLAQYRKTAGMAINVLLVLLLAFLIYNNRAMLPTVGERVTVFHVGLSLLLYFASLLLQWSVWMSLMGYERGHWQRGLEEYIRTIFMGWLPGGIWKLVGRLTVYRAPDRSSKSIFLVNLVELGIALLANGVVLLLVSQVAWRLRLAGLGALLLLLLLAPQVSRWLPAQPHISRSRLRWPIWTGSYVLSWLCGGLISYLVISTFAPAINVADSVRYWCLAGAAGLVLQVLPLSMLVRDVTLVALLQPVMPLSAAITIALAVRLMMLVCELMAGWTLLGIVWLASRDK